MFKLIISILRNETAIHQAINPLRFGCIILKKLRAIIKNVETMLIL